MKLKLVNLTTVRYLAQKEEDTEPVVEDGLSLRTTRQLEDWQDIHLRRPRRHAPRPLKQCVSRWCAK